MCLFATSALLAQPGTGYIQVTVEPGVQVFLDGSFKGVSTAEQGGLILSGVTPGRHQLKVVKEGFQPQEDTVVAAEGKVFEYKVQSFTPKLEIVQRGSAANQQVVQKVGSLLIQSLPVACKVSIPSLGLRGQEKNQDEMEFGKVPTGTYAATFAALGKSVNHTFEISDGQRTHLFVNILEGKVQDVNAEARTRRDDSAAAMRGGSNRSLRELGLELIWIGPGSFAMGTASGGDNDERPVTQVTLTQGFWLGQTEVTQAQAVEHYYEHPRTETQQGDEFIPATWVVDAAGKPVATFADGDAVLFYNYRGDRPREITKAFVLDDFKGFDRGPKLDLYYATMTEYEAGLPVHVVSPKPEKLKHILGEVVAAAGIPQFRCAETEKNPHVTFFFNNYRSEPFPGEDRACPASPKVATYDMQPEMSAVEVTAAAKAAILSGNYGLIVVNYANPDMVGHTGSIPAATKAVEATDRGVGELLAALKQQDGRAVILADHGNCEQMWDFASNCPHTSHTLNLVEVFVVGSGFTRDGTKLRSGGRLADVAPTVLELMGLPKPAEMTGESLLAT